ncbi:hypothetical protein [Paracoccus onubensis]|uniref:Uncharacterized protein n=1 Tax=Paracoccus onubensis TaxID=1675788 RepID=A0A418T438_9RHOB|nr:hypothetical protein [Paracoccus onubensis]RJE87983.1 hypothetical protein D3P04_03415 [Paracoccus onubensis]
MSDIEERLDAIEERLNALEGNAEHGGLYRENGGLEISLRDTFRYLEHVARVMNGIYAAIDQSKLSPSDRADLRQRFSDYDAAVMSLVRHPRSPG